MQEASGMCVTAVHSSNVLPVDFPDMLVETIQTKTHNRHENTNSEQSRSKDEGKGERGSDP